MAHGIEGTGPIEVIAQRGWFGAATGWGALPELVDPAKVPATGRALGTYVMLATWPKHHPGSQLDANAGRYPMYEAPVGLVTGIEKTLSTVG